MDSKMQIALRNPLLSQFTSSLNSSYLTLFFQISVIEATTGLYSFPKSMKWTENTATAKNTCMPLIDFYWPFFTLKLVVVCGRTAARVQIVSFHLEGIPSYIQCLCIEIYHLMRLTPKKAVMAPKLPVVPDLCWLLNHAMGLVEGEFIVSGQEHVDNLMKQTAAFQHLGMGWAAAMERHITWYSSHCSMSPQQLHVF